MRGGPLRTVGEALPELIAAHGFEVVFGIPGVHTVEFYRGLPRSGLRHVTPRHEQGAGFMADGYARAGGRPAACFVISGPGMTNIATAMGQAYADSVPMLVISSVLNRRELGKGEGRLHDLKDQRALAEGVAAFSQTVIEPAELPGALARAMTVFRSVRPRPVHIELPLDVIAATEAPPMAAARPAPPPAAPDPQAIARAADLLRAARSPLMILGGGASGAPEAVRALVEAIGAPVVLTVNGKGLLPPGHPLLVGSVLSQAPVREAVRDADVVLAVGTELGETDSFCFGGRLELTGQLVRIDIDPEQLGRNATPAVGIVADAGPACSALLATLGQDRDPVPGHSRAAGLRNAARAGLPEAYRTHGRILDRVAETLPGVIIAGDSTQPVYGGNLSFDAAAPRRWFNSATGFGTLGYGLPAALGARLACPDRPVVALVGDGSLQFTIGELATAVELRLPVPIVLWNNRGYGEIKQFMRDRGIPEIGVDIFTPDFQAIARGFGCLATRAPTLDALAGALVAATDADGPTLIEIDEADALGW